MSIERKCKIFSLTGIHPSTGDAQADVVFILEELMKRAQKGEIVGLAVAFVEGNNDIGVGIADGCAHAGLIVGAVSALDYEINQKWSEWSGR